MAVQLMTSGQLITGQISDAARAIATARRDVEHCGGRLAQPDFTLAYRLIDEARASLDSLDHALDQARKNQQR